MHSIHASSLDQEGALQVSKWLKYAFLLDAAEMTSFLQAIDPCFLIPSGFVVSEDEGIVEREVFLEQYRIYVQWMQSQDATPPASLRRFFSLMMTSSLDCLYAVELAKEKRVIKPRLPVIQMQLYQAFFSPMDQKIHSMVMHSDSIGCGLQISYPQIYEDPNTHQFAKVLLSEEFVNTLLFKKIVHWLREHTKVPFLPRGKQQEPMPFRIGKNSSSMMDGHKGLAKWS